MLLDDAKMTKPVRRTCLEMNKMSDVDVETQATCLDMECECEMLSLCFYRHYSCCWCLGACTFVHGHSFSNSSLVKLTINEWIKYDKYMQFFLHCCVQNVATVTKRRKFLWSLGSSWLFMSEYYFSLAVCTCLIWLYVRPAMCIVSAAFIFSAAPVVKQLSGKLVKLVAPDVRF